MFSIYLLARLLHVLSGAIWVGTVTFTSFFLMPAMMEAGPDAAKVMAGLQRRRFMDLLPLVRQVVNPMADTVDARQVARLVNAVERLPEPVTVESMRRRFLELAVLPSGVDGRAARNSVLDNRHLECVHARGRCAGCNELCSS